VRDRAFVASVLRAMLVFVFGSVVCAPAWSQATDWQKISIPPLPQFNPQEPRRIQLDNGMVIFLQEDHELPLIGGFARIRGGSGSEPATKTGLVDLYGEVWRTGGTKNQTGDQLDDSLEARAAKVETGGGFDSTTIGMSCLKQDFDDVFKTFDEVLRTPEFRPDKLELAQRGMFDDISRRNDEIGQIVGRESTRLGYGANTSYGRLPEYATIAAVTRQDLIEWHRVHVQPNNIILGLTGDFDSNAIEAKLRNTYGAWPKGPSFKKSDLPTNAAKPGYYVIDKSDVNQSEISFVETGIRRDNPDYYAASVFSEAFGGGFSSRLFYNIRSKAGLAYSVGGGIGSAFDHVGLTRIGMGTKSESTVDAIQALFKEIDDLGKNPIREDEIRRAKDTILNSFIFNFDSSQKVLRERMLYEFYGYPADYLERYRAGIDKVTQPDVARVATKYIHKDQFKILVVGNTSEFGKSLDTLGHVNKIDISIPPPPGETPAATK